MIDFIDMDERKNNAAVEKRFKDKLKTDRARIQVGRISGFGLMEMSRQRLRPGMLEATTQMCSHCHGTGLLRSDDNVALSILRQLEEEGVRARSKEVLVRAPIAIANFLMNGKRENIAEIEARYGMSVRVECDPTLISPDFVVEKFKIATRIVPEAAPIVTSALLMDDDEDDDLIIETPDEDEEEAAPATTATAPAAASPDADGEDRPKRKRRRRRRRRNGAGDAQQADGTDPSEADDEAETVAQPAQVAATEDKPKRRRTRTRKPADAAPQEVSETVAAAVTDTAVAAEPAQAPEPDATPAKRTRSRRKPAVASDAAAEPAPAAETAATEDVPAPAKRRSRAKPKAAEPAPAEVAEPAVETPTEAAPAVEPAPAPQPAPASAPEPAADKPRRKGWWSLGK